MSARSLILSAIGAQLLLGCVPVCEGAKQRKIQESHLTIEDNKVQRIFTEEAAPAESSGERAASERRYLKADYLRIFYLCRGRLRQVRSLL